jgi:hypothetical protein
VFAIAFTPDSRSLLSGSDDATVRVWDVESGQCVHIMQGYAVSLYDVAWSPDGMRLASCGGREGGELFVWEVHNGERVRALAEHPGVVFAVAWSPSGEMLISGGSDGMLRWWDLQHGECMQVRKAHQETVQSLKRSPDGRLVASCGDDGAIHVWDLASGEHLRTFQDIQAVLLTLYSMGGKGESHASFCDNHDQSRRFFYRDPRQPDAYDDQISLGVGCLFSLLGVPCLYYGTEHGLAGGSPPILDLRLVESVSKQAGRRVEPLTNRAGAALLAQLEQATHLARGPFLASFTLRDSQFFDDWSRQHREYWHLRVQQLFDVLSRLYERAGDGGARHTRKHHDRWWTRDSGEHDCRQRDHARHRQSAHPAIHQVLTTGRTGDHSRTRAN